LLLKVSLDFLDPLAVLVELRQLVWLVIAEEWAYVFSIPLNQLVFCIHRFLFLLKGLREVVWVNYWIFI